MLDRLINNLSPGLLFCLALFGAIGLESSNLPTEPAPAQLGKHQCTRFDHFPRGSVKNDCYTPSSLRQQTLAKTFVDHLHNSLVPNFKKKNVCDELEVSSPKNCVTSFKTVRCWLWCYDRSVMTLRALAHCSLPSPLSSPYSTALATYFYSLTLSWAPRGAKGIVPIMFE